MVMAAKKVVEVCDSSKFNRRSLSLIVPASEIDHVITDSQLSQIDARAIRDAGIELTIV
jgi:DeoR family transcriptional regulator of aga operon